MEPLYKEQLENIRLTVTRCFCTPVDMIQLRYWLPCAIWLDMPHIITIIPMFKRCMGTLSAHRLCQQTHMCNRCRCTGHSVRLATSWTLHWLWQWSTCTVGHGCSPETPTPSPSPTPTPGQRQFPLPCSACRWPRPPHPINSSVCSGGTVGMVRAGHSD